MYAIALKLKGMCIKMWKTKEFVEYMSVHKQSPAATQRTLKMLSPILDNDFTNVTPEQVENLVIDFMPTSQTYVLSIVSRFKAYAEFIDNIKLYNILVDINKEALWKKIKPNCPVKYLSENMFQDIYNDIDRFEEHNALYYKTLFWSVFEGIYSDNMDVLRNLRASDINGSVVTLRRDDGYTYQIDVSEKLAKDLVELSKTNIWYRPNRSGVCSVAMVGRYNDSCFKVERRQTNNDNIESFKHPIYKKVQKICQNYIGFKIPISDLFVSGLMCKIKKALEDNGFNFMEVFNQPRNNKGETHKIIDEVIKKYNYSGSSVAVLRTRIRGNADMFI